MKLISKFRYNKLLAGVLAISLFFSIFILPAAPALAADDIVLTIRGNGVERTVQFTMAQLQALEQETHDYSGYNFYPSLQVFEDTTGVTLQTLLDQAGLKAEATMIKIKEPNTSFSYYTRRDLLEVPRYYFPAGEDISDCQNWPPAGRGSEEGKVLVPAMIAFMCKDEPFYGGKLIYGQQTPLEPTACNGEQFTGMLKGGTIEVTCDDLSKWYTPDAYPDSGWVTPGTEVKLQYGDGSLWHTKIYYTLDGSEPTVWSNIYNISYPIFQPFLNKPIPVTTEPVTIKARAIGMGKLDSDVVTFDYRPGKLACAVQGAGIYSIYCVEGLREMTASQVTYQYLDAGQTVTVEGTGVLLSALLENLGAASNWEVKFVTISGQEYDGGTVQDIRDQQCMLAYDVNGASVSDESGDETATIQILRNSGDPNLNRLQYVNCIKLVNVDDEIIIDDVELLDPDGASITSAAPGGGYCIEVNAINALDTVKNALLIIQVRSGAGAERTGGGKVIGYMAARTGVDVNGGNFRAEFTLPGDVSGTAYVDVFVWDDFIHHYPLGSEDHSLSFAIE